MSVGLQRQTKAPCQSEVCNFNESFLVVDQQVAWLEISVHDSPLVAVQKPREYLPQDDSDLVELERHALLVQILLHVHVEELEDQGKFVLAVDDLLQLDDAWVVQLP